jgi:hypothetical protein
LKKVQVKCPKSNFIKICLKESFHREKKDEETFFVFMWTDLPPGLITQREERLRKTFFVFFAQKRFFLVFLLSVEVLLEADPNDF